MMRTALVALLIAVSGIECATGSCVGGIQCLVGFDQSICKNTPGCKWKDDKDYECCGGFQCIGYDMNSCNILPGCEWSVVTPRPIPAPTAFPTPVPSHPPTPRPTLRPTPAPSRSHAPSHTFAPTPTPRKKHKVTGVDAGVVVGCVLGALAVLVAGGALGWAAHRRWGGPRVPRMGVRLTQLKEMRASTEMEHGEYMRRYQLILNGDPDPTPGVC